MEGYVQIHHADADITVVETEYVYHMKRPLGFTFSKADQDYHIIALILGGSAKYRINKKSFTVQKGDVLFFRKGTHYNAKVVSQEPWEHIYENWHIDAPSHIGYLTNYFRKLSEAKSTSCSTAVP